VTYLLDTHVILWFRLEPERLGAKSLKLLSKRQTNLAISAVSALEIAQLVYKGRVEIGQPVDQWFQESLRLFGCRVTAISPEVSAAAYSLSKPFHSDPADRILVATALKHKQTLLTADRRILQSGIGRTFDTRL
jgi:PIN domain nuclease of toxin-antitoxin system